MVLGVGLLAVLTGLTAFSMNPRSHPTGPPWLPNVVACRDVPMTHVHDPGRLLVRSRCATVSGTVKSVRMVSAYDDLKVTVIPDAQLLPFLNKANNGVVVADIIATDQTSVVIPPVDSRITAWGTWVTDKASKITQLLPAYYISIDQFYTLAQRTSKSSYGTYLLSVHRSFVSDSKIMEIDSCVPLAPLFA